MYARAKGVRSRFVFGLLAVPLVAITTCSNPAFAGNGQGLGQGMSWATLNKARFAFGGHNHFWPGSKSGLDWWNHHH
ncbi:MAG: hypothetical protein C5B53_03270, partial [Candidatus Melainabacteria bacterium]